MARGITWTVQYRENVFDDIYRLLYGLKKESQLAKGALKSLLGGGTAARRDNILYILEDVDFIDLNKKGNTTYYKINENGLKYLDASSDQDSNEKRLFHTHLYFNVLHYSYAYDFILENEFYEFKKEDFIENLVLNSSIDYGTRIYDWKSAEYVLAFMRSLKVISKIENEFVVNDEYRKIFDEIKFIEIIEEILKDDSMFTKNLCEDLIDKSDEFMATKGAVSIDNIYKKILKANEIREFLKFVPGLSRPPIPANNTLVELKGV